MATTLLLNASYEPMKVISWQRAITLVFLGKVEVVEAYDDEIRSVSASLPMPSVVRLRRYARQDRRVKFSRTNVYILIPCHTTFTNRQTQRPCS